MDPRIARCVFALVGAALLAPASVGAFETLGTQWPLDGFPNGVPFCIDPAAQDAANGETQAEFEQAILRANARWTPNGSTALGVAGTGCGSWQATQSTCSSAATLSANDNWIYWESDWDGIPGLSSDVIAATPWFSRNGVTINAKILFNDQYFSWGTQGQSLDVETIALHEFGHFAGLDHHDAVDANKAIACASSSPPSIMCAVPPTLFRELTADDRDGICALYLSNGMFGDACVGATQCLSGICHPEAYCTESCSQSGCPLGASCGAGSLCEPDGGTTTLSTGDSCANTTNRCTAGDLCRASGSGSFCRRQCASDASCDALGQKCSFEAAQSGVCIPIDPACSCDDRSFCQASCGCDVDCGACACDTSAACDEGCACDLNCGDCACDLSVTCEVGCVCDPECAECACNTTTACEVDCTCDPNCSQSPSCTCDTTFVCDPDCGCDPECACACDTTGSCDDSCSCDPDCASINDGCQTGHPFWIVLLPAALTRTRRRRHDS